MLRKAVPREKDYKLFAGGRLYLLVTCKGSKYWRYKYEFAGKERTLALGVYPNVSLAEARDAREQARIQLKNGVDPNTVKRISKQESKSII